MFESPPFIECPHCHERAFGVLLIAKSHYVRRCSKCGHPRANQAPASYPLPPLRKKIIYLDQFLIGNMVKALHPSSPIKDRSDLEYYKGLFCKLDRLSKLQVIICPDSEFHETESELARDFSESYSKVYELLSNGVSFWDHWTIWRYQVFDCAKAWFSEKTESLDRDAYFHGDPHTWQDRLRISVKMPRDGDYKINLTSTRDLAFNKICEAARRWATEKGGKWEEWYEEELREWPRIILEGHQASLMRIWRVFLGQDNNPLNMVPSWAQLTFEDIKRACGDDQKRAIGFFNSGAYRKTPFIEIMSGIFASIADKMANGGMSPEKIDRGMANDVFIASTFLPYCDAVFIDRFMGGVLTEPRIQKITGESARVFSMATKREFQNYLDGIERSVSEDHLKLVAELYGENWAKPFVTVLEH